MTFLSVSTKIEKLASYLRTEEASAMPILKNKLFLYLTEFFAGMSVMAVELGASRLLAPYFSSSQIVWTIIIGTIMIAMALGNIYGGRSADKNPNPDKLYGRILVAAVWIAAIPVVGKYIIMGISALLIFTVSTNFLIWAALAACMVIFVFPLFLLGTVTPSLAKYSVDSLEDSGKVVGTLGAFNTIGSIIGTFVPTFLSIPSVGTSVTFLIFAGILLVLSLIYFISGRRGAVKCAVAAALYVICCVFGRSGSFAFWESGLTYEGESIYNYLQVKEDSRRVILSTNVLFGVQSLMMKEDGLTGMYYDYAMAAPLMAGQERPEECSVLILGMGTGTYARQCRSYFGGDMEIEGVEIDGKITDLARTYFDLPGDVEVTTYDGRAYLNAVDKKYDVIMVDAYEQITIPFQMSSMEFFMLVQAHLAPDGVMVVNMNMRGSGEENINAYLSDTIAAVFEQVYTVDVTGSTNRELFAGNGPLLENLQARLEAVERADLIALLGDVAARLTPYQPGQRIMTDDKAPVELLGMRVIDELIRDEVAYYKNIYEREGIRGVINGL